MSFSNLLRYLGDCKCASKGKMVHGQMITSGFLPDIITTNHLISMYTKCDLVDDARRAFDQMPEKNVISWSILISGYSKSGHTEESITTFRSMISKGFVPNHFTFVSVLSACATIGASMTGKEIHGRIYRVEHGVLSSFVSNSLLNLYAKCGKIQMARRVFDGILLPNLVAWGSIISGCCQCGESDEALRLFSRARREGVEINEFVLTSILSACSGIGDLIVRKQVHCHVIKSGNGSDRFVEAGIIDLYIKCGDLESAYQAFSELDEPGLASWAAMIGGFAQQGQGDKAMDLFRKLHLTGLRPNEYIFPSILVACSVTTMVEGGMQLHSVIIKSGYRMASYVGNAVMDFYAKCGLLEESSKVFEEMEERDIVSWNAMIARQIEQGHSERAINMLRHMLLEGKDPNLYTYSSILSLCADLPAIGWGQQTHNRIIKPGLDTHVVVGSALIDMYAKCGKLNDARKVLDRLSSKNLVSYNSMLVGYAQHGFGKEALEIFNKMEMESITPNDITFIGVLSACGHVGLVEQGQCYFDLMKEHGITQRIDHFACMVDLFARAGQTKGAYEFIRSMPLEPNKVIWRSLLAGCRAHGDLGIGRHAAQQILEMDPEDTAACVMLSGAYAHAGMWGERAEVRGVEERGLKKVPGCSWIEVKNRNHCFFAGDAAGGHGDWVCEALTGLAVQMVDAGYAPKADILHCEE